MDTTNLVLGKSTSYQEEYSPSLLQRIERQLGRSAIKNLKSFEGFDVWHLYELTYLNLNGLPCVCMGCMIVPAKSKYIVESKSLKLYTMSFTMTRFKDLSFVQKVFERDLSKLLECKVEVKLYPLHSKDFAIHTIKGTCLEELRCCKDLNFKNFEYSPEVLAFDDKKEISKTYYTNLFRSLCPVTAQPDYASLMICYEGRKLKEERLLTYLVSLRHHQGFHEQCVELIYSDLVSYLNPKKLTVAAFFTRRGGIDINPVRTNQKSLSPLMLRTIRQ